MRKIWYWIKKLILGYEPFYGVDNAIDGKDYSCRVTGKRLRNGTIIIDDIEFLNPKEVGSNE